MIKNKQRPIAGINPIKIHAIWPPVINAITAENIIISGARTTALMTIWKAIWTVEISVVILVTKLEAENLSILAKLNVSSFLYISLLRFAAIPTDALEAKTPPKIPQVNESSAMPTNIIPVANKLMSNSNGPFV